MRKDLTDRIIDKINARLMSVEYTKENVEEYYTSKEILAKCTLEQLWSIYKLTERDIQFKILRCDPADHLAIAMPSCLTNGNIYVGIEPDGYTHS